MGTADPSASSSSNGLGVLLWDIGTASDSVLPKNVGTDWRDGAVRAP